MRLAVSKRDFYHADIYCADTQSAKKILREKPISILALDYYLVGRERGDDLIKWAGTKNVLPLNVVITESDRIKRSLLASALSHSGYRTGDGTTFMRLA